MISPSASATNLQHQCLNQDVSLPSFAKSRAGCTPPTSFAKHLLPTVRLVEPSQTVQDSSSQVQPAWTEALLGTGTSIAIAAIDLQQDYF